MTKKNKIDYFNRGLYIPPKVIELEFLAPLSLLSVYSVALRHHHRYQPEDEGWEDIIDYDDEGEL